MITIIQIPQFYSLFFYFFIRLLKCKELFFSIIRQFIFFWNPVLKMVSYKINQNDHHIAFYLDSMIAYCINQETLYYFLGCFFKQALSYNKAFMNPTQREQQYNQKIVFERVQNVIEKNKASDLFSKAFLRPQQIVLKTWKTQNDKNKHHDALPYGLKQVIKKDISLNKYVLQDFNSFGDLLKDQRNIQYIRQNNYENLISLLKPKGNSGKIQLCICICMYSQDKTMLRKTLTGVANNIAIFVQNGIPSNQIVVAVVMDGIQKVDPSVVQFFSQMQKQSNIYLDDDIQPIQAKEIAKQNFSNVQDEQVINISSFIFDQIQLEDRKKRRFAERKRQYQIAKKMKSRIQMHEHNKKIIFDDLDQVLKPFFFKKALQYRKRQYADQNLGPVKITQQQLLAQYGDNTKKSRPIIYQALGQAKTYYQKYIQTRDDLALLNSFRVDVNFGSFQKRRHKKNYEQLLQQQNNISSVKMNLFFITKYKNSGKLSSHNWFFNGLCKQMNNQYAVLLDVGLCPQKTALYRMYRHMKNDIKCGGVCGYMNLRIERLQDEDQNYLKQIDWVSKLSLHIIDIQRAQQVQYHFAHLIDKPFEALFKFIHVLPGAFSAYRTKALQPSQQDSKIMREYFKSLQDSTSRQLGKSDYSTCKAIFKVILPDFLFEICYKKEKQLTEQQLLYNSNVYLAEDRTLCMGIHQNGYQLQYLPDAHAYVDPIKHLHGLLGQRKRWINGSFFAFQSVKQGLNEQNNRRDFCLKIQIFYLTLMNMLAFVSPALFLFTVHIAMFAFRDWFFGYILNPLTSTTFQTTQFYNSFVYLMDFIYIISMLGLVLKSMHFTHRTEQFLPFIYGISTVMGLFSIAVFTVLFIDMAQGIADSIKCLARPNQVCQVTFLAQVPALRALFFKNLPGGMLTYMIYKWVVVGVIALYVVPILVYAISYCRCQFLVDVLFGTLSFIFYTPTYLNILNTFALCRIDDISWGTKGLDSEDTKNNKLKQSWKSIKILHVAKFVFWNIIVGAVMLIVSSPINLWGVISTEQYNQLMVQSYVRKFFMTFLLMAVIGFSLFLKIILGAMYTIAYRCTHNTSEKQIMQGIGSPKALKAQMSRASVDQYFNQIKPSMVEQLKSYIHCLIQNVTKNKLAKDVEINNLTSLIVANKKLTNGSTRKKDKQKWDNINKNRSKVIKKKTTSSKSRQDIQQPISLNLNQTPLQASPLTLAASQQSHLYRRIVPYPTPIPSPLHTPIHSPDNMPNPNSTDNFKSLPKIRPSQQQQKQPRRLFGIF